MARIRSIFSLVAQLIIPKHVGTLAEAINRNWAIIFSVKHLIRVWKNIYLLLLRYTPNFNLAVKTLICCSLKSNQSHRSVVLWNRRSPTSCCSLKPNQSHRSVVLNPTCIRGRSGSLGHGGHSESVWGMLWIESFRIVRNTVYLLHQIQCI